MNQKSNTYWTHTLVQVIWWQLNTMIASNNVYIYALQVQAQTREKTTMVERTICIRFPFLRHSQCPSKTHNINGRDPRFHLCVCITQVMYRNVQTMRLDTTAKVRLISDLKIVPDLRSRVISKKIKIINVRLNDHQTSNAKKTFLS